MVSGEEQKKEKWEMSGRGLKGGSKGRKAITRNNQICLEAWEENLKSDMPLSIFFLPSKIISSIIKTKPLKRCIELKNRGPDRKRLGWSNNSDLEGRLGGSVS